MNFMSQNYLPNCSQSRPAGIGRLLPVGKLIASGRFGAETGGWFLVRIIFSGSIEPEYPLHSLSRSYWQQLKGRRHE